VGGDHQEDHGLSPGKKLVRPPPFQSTGTATRKKKVWCSGAQLASQPRSRDDRSQSEAGPRPKNKTPPHLGAASTTGPRCSG
jgi:hypothetical protein